MDLGEHNSSMIAVQWQPPQLRPGEGLWEHPSKQEGTGAPVLGSSQGNRGPQETGQEQSI